MPRAIWRESINDVRGEVRLDTVMAIPYMSSCESADMNGLVEDSEPALDDTDVEPGQLRVRWRRECTVAS